MKPRSKKYGTRKKKQGKPPKERTLKRDPGENECDIINGFDSKGSELSMSFDNSLRDKLRKRIVKTSNEQMEKGIVFAREKIFELRDRYKEKLTVDKIMIYIFEKLLNWIKSNIMTFIVAGGTLAYAGAQIAVTCNMKPKSESDNIFSCPTSVANNKNLNFFLLKVMEGYFDAFPDDIAFHPHASRELIRKRFQIHDSRPENIKRISDIAEKLLLDGKNLVSCIYF